MNKETIKAHLKSTVDKYYQIDGNSVGGSLHIVLDDNNIDADSIRYCAEYALQNGDLFGWQLAQWLLMFDKSELHDILSITDETED